MTPAEVKTLQAYLRKKFNFDGIEIKKRHKKEDSVEVFVKAEFVGVIFKDDEDGELAYQFQMAILEEDLKDYEG